MNAAKNAPMSAGEVLPCPFCGHSAHYDTCSDWVSCDGCGATGPTGDDQVSAINGWNIRTAVAAMAEREAAQAERIKVLEGALEFNRIRAADRDALLGEVEALRADAERWRWARHPNNREAAAKCLTNKMNANAAIDAARTEVDPT